MRLAKEKSREYKGKAYYKYLIFLPNKIRKKLGWDAGDELACSAIAWVGTRSLFNSYRAVRSATR